MSDVDLDAYELSRYDLTEVPDEDLCPLCLNQVVVQRARIEMGLEPAELKLCPADKAKEHIILRERMSFPEVAADWANMVRDIEGMANRDGYIPVRIMLPNGTAFTTKVLMSVEPMRSDDMYQIRTAGQYGSREIEGRRTRRLVRLALHPVAYIDEIQTSILQPGSFQEVHVQG